MINRLAVPLLALSLIAPQVGAQENEVDALFEALALPEMIEIMALEGTEYGTQIASDLIPGGVTAEWNEAVDQIYDTGRMKTEVLAAFKDVLLDEDVTPILAFFESEPGKTIIGLEVSARRALLDDAVEEASKEMAALAMADETDRFALIERFVVINDLIETNVVGALNSNYAFYDGLSAGGAFPQSLTEDQILADVWSQEPQIRQNTTEWVYSFLLMAYQPLSDADVETYIAFSESDAGKVLNRALFASFDDMFENISRALGVAAAAQMTTQEL